ncbi:MAG: hypothetical protein ACRCRZ_01460 [Metamycoplasmataceae bacterium]
MFSFILITHQKEFTKNIKDYFLLKNNIKTENVYFHCFGLDYDNFDDILNYMNEFWEKKPKINQAIIFTDLGESYKIGKKLVENNKNQFILAKTSILENGYLVYILLNTKAPFKTIEPFIEKWIDKKEFE